MEIRNIRHKGLRSFVLKDNPKGLPQDALMKIADVMAFLIDMENIEEIFDLQKYKPHLLSGKRSSTYSFHITANWRLTFKHDESENELFDINYEDYH